LPSVTAVAVTAAQQHAWLEGLARAIEGTVRVCRGIFDVTYAASSTGADRLDFPVVS
jgi:hypothetical protein